VNVNCQPPTNNDVAHSLLASSPWDRHRL